MNKKPMFLYLRQKPQFHLAEGHIPHTLEGVGIECATYLSYSPSLQPLWGTHFRTLGPVTIESALLSRIASIKRGSTGGAGGSRTHTVWFFRPALRPRKLPPQMQGTNYWSYISNINLIIAVCALLSVVLRSSGTFSIGETKNSELFLEELTK